MNVKLKVLTAGVLFFAGQVISAQEVNDSLYQENDVKETKIKEVEIIGGYGKKSTKSKSSMASTTINADALENRPSTSFLNSIQGSAPGVSINSQSGSPGSGKINIKVRGLSSLGASTDPLYVIDGMISTSSEYRNLNPNDIETLSILKDAQATAIYGNYGASGVVVITTKGGKFNSGLRISYDATTSFSFLPNHKYDLMSAKELLLVQKRISDANGLNANGQHRVATIGGGMTLDQINAYEINTDWGKQFFRPSFAQNHNLGLRYGGENFSGFTSLGYLDTEGIVKNTDFKRFTFRTNINGRSANRKLTYAAQIALGHSKRTQLDSETNTTISNNSIQNPLLGMLTGAPIFEPYNGNGRDLFNQYGFGATRMGRGIWVLDDVVKGGIQKLYKQTSISVNTNVSYKILDGLSITNKLGVNYKNNAFNFARTPNGYLSVAVASQNRTEYGGFETINNQHDTLINSITSINYDKKIGNHTITLGAYLDYVRGFYSVTEQTQNGLNPLDWSLGAGTGYIPFNAAEPSKYLPSVAANKVKAGTLAYIGTLDYDYDSRYGIAATLRRDASYRFSDLNKWETFWSVAGRWNIDKEVFMEGSIFNLLKLRASYGTNGNQNLGLPSNNANSLFLLPGLVRESYNTTVGYANVVGASTTLVNPDARWEKVSQANVGLDFGLWSNKVEGSVDVYEKKTSDMYLFAPISAATGAYTIAGNAGDMRNRGIEASLRYTPFNGRNGDFRLSVFANFAYNNNKVTHLVNENLSSDLVSPIGGTAYQWNLYKYAGVNKANGQYLFVDKNGNITENITQADRQLTGKSTYAPYTGGFGFDVDYKGFYFTSLFSFQAGGWSNDAMHFWLNRPSFIGNSGFNATKEMLNAWTPTNTDTDIASLTASNVDLLGSSDKYLRRTDYIRLKNISLGYNVSKNALENLPIRGLKVYVMGENLMTWTSWKGFDPETALGQSLGIYPNSKTYSVGVNIEF